MEQNKKNQQPDSTDNDPEEFKDEVTKNKINRHLTDINDTISEEDIKNIDTDISSPEVPGEGKETAEKEPLDDDKKDEEKDGGKDDLPTSWNILE